MTPLRPTTAALGAAFLILAVPAARAQRSEIAADAPQRVRWAGVPGPERAIERSDAAADAPADSELRVDWNGDGLDDVLRLDAAGRLELLLARPDGGLVASELRLEDALEGPIAQVALVRRPDADAGLDLVLVDPRGRPRVLHRGRDGRVRVDLDLWRARRDAGAPAPDAIDGSTAGGAPGTKGITVADALRDRADDTPLTASSAPVLGDLYPLSSDLFVSPTGKVGVGTTSPGERLTVAGGDARVDGDVALGLPGGESVLVRAALDGQPTFELRDASGATTLSIGESAVDPGLRTGLELVEPSTGTALYRSALPDGIELADAETGSVGVRLGSDALHAFNASGFTTLDLIGGPGGVDARLNEPSGVEAIVLDTDPGTWGGARLRLLGTGGHGELQLGRRVLSADGKQAETRLAVGDTITLSSSRPGSAADQGSLIVRNSALEDTIRLDAIGTSGGPELALSDGLDERLRISASGTSGGASVEVLEPGGKLVGRIDGDTTSFLASGALTLFDENTGTRTVDLQGDVGSGSALSVVSPAGVEVVRLDAASAGIYVRRANGLPGTVFEGAVMRIYDASGVETINYDGDTGSKSAIVATPDHGARRLYAIESPEVWFEDSGEARLADGVARVDLDPVFLETVTVTADEPLLVFVTPTGACEGLWVEPDASGFRVHERAGGASAATFDWRVLARRKGAEGVRFAEYEDQVVSTATDEKEDDR